MDEIRQAASRALAKAIAYKNCGRDEEAERWAVEVVRLLRDAEMIPDEVCRARA